MKKEVGFEHSAMFLSNDLHGICRLRLHLEAQQLLSLQSLPWTEKYPLRQCWTQGSPSWLSLEWELHHCHCVEPMPEQAGSMCIPSLLQSPPLVPATLHFSPNSHPSILVESAPPRSHTHTHTHPQIRTIPSETPSKHSSSLKLDLILLKYNIFLHLEHASSRYMPNS